MKSVDKVLLVLNLMYDEGCEAEYASPNFVAEFASNKDITLRSEEVVSISNFYGEDNCPTSRSNELEF